MSILLDLRVSLAPSNLSSVCLQVFLATCCQYFRLLLNVLHGLSGSNQNLVRLLYIMDYILVITYSSSFRRASKSSFRLLFSDSLAFSLKVERVNRTLDGVAHPHFPIF